MRRRTLLQLVGGLAVAGVRASAFQSGRRSRIVIAGGGMLGANIAYQLAKRGASVTLLERAKPATGATANSFAWINAKKQPIPFSAMARTRERRSRRSGVGYRYSSCTWPAPSIERRRGDASV